MKDVSRIWWIIIGGILTSIFYLTLGVVCCASIILIPFGLKCFELTELLINPTDKVTKLHFSSKGSLNVIWFILFGIESFILVLLLGIIMIITIIGAKTGKSLIKNAKAFLFPFGVKISNVEKKFDSIPFENEKYIGKIRNNSLIFIGILTIVLGCFAVIYFGIDILMIANRKGYGILQIFIKSKIIINLFVDILLFIGFFFVIDLGVIGIRLGLKEKVIMKKSAIKKQEVYNSDPEKSIYDSYEIPDNPIMGEAPSFSLGSPAYIEPRVKNNVDYSFDAPISSPIAQKPEEKANRGFYFDESDLDIPVFNEPETQENETKKKSKGLVIPNDDFEQLK